MHGNKNIYKIRPSRRIEIPKAHVGNKTKGGTSEKRCLWTVKNGSIDVGGEGKDYEMQLMLQAETMSSSFTCSHRWWPRKWTRSSLQDAINRVWRFSDRTGPSFLPWKRRCEGWTSRNHLRWWEDPTTVVDMHASELDNDTGQGLWHNTLNTSLLAPCNSLTESLSLPNKTQMVHRFWTMELG